MTWFVIVLLTVAGVLLLGRFRYRLLRGNRK